MTKLRFDKLYNLQVHNQMKTVDRSDSDLLPVDHWTCLQIWPQTVRKYDANINTYDLYEIYKTELEIFIQ